MMVQAAQDLIEQAFETRASLNANSVPILLTQAIDDVFAELDAGRLRIAEFKNHQWQTNQWLKKAILLSFCIRQNHLINGDCSHFFDKMPLKFSHTTQAEFMNLGIRVVPPAVARAGSYIAKNVVLMPSYVNVGAYIDEGTMIDTWATIGSCAQIGKNVHISGGVGIGGVLEPLQANPVIIEDDCFIGARSEVVEGVIVERGSVLSMGVFLGQSTRIYNRQTKEITYGRIPPFSVVVPGNLPASDGSHSLYCAVIVKQVDASTRSKIGLNTILRNALDETAGVKN